MMRLTAAAAAALLLAGCASFSSDGGFDKVIELTKDRTGQAAKWQRTASDTESAHKRSAEILNGPLTADGAVELALLNNPGLQASYAELGIAEADLVRAGRLANPSFRFGRISGGGITEIDRSVMFTILGLLTMPAATEVEQRRFEQAQYQAASTTVGLAADTRKAFFSAVASQDLVKYYQRVKEAADASNELARRMVQAGNFNKLSQMRQQAFYADATSQLARAQHRATAERERLVRLLGLSANRSALKLPDRLPDLPSRPLEPKDAEQTAMDKRLDVQMAKRSSDATAKALGLTRATRFVNVLNVGYANKSQTGEERENGYEIELELPIFDFGTARTARAESAYMQSLQRTAEVAVNAQSEVRESYSAYRTAYDLAKHNRDEVVPLKKRISDENLLRYNGMLIGVFELLADSRDQVRSVTDYVESLRDYWIAETNLQTALTGRSPGESGSLSRPSAISSAAGGDAAH
ncbi:TolC family protein [Variovorax ginsengisoli]|uniref:TolC family protein n=1 Tax=Variovorax ginsengisoli TaxID=363844 RepID=A0ABT8S5B7_9BURK|nr:TolC family protein [Variovorax ginsengisoli]MDN8614949.1 TolC family protein [Variovorax ginsengisoli]MDO1534119.1 TolC family protein [Variovorax ginsengisoli]